MLVHSLAGCGLHSLLLWEFTVEELLGELPSEANAATANATTLFCSCRLGVLRALTM